MLCSEIKIGDRFMFTDEDTGEDITANVNDLHFSTKSDMMFIYFDNELETTMGAPRTAKISYLDIVKV